MESDKTSGKAPALASPGTRVIRCKSCERTVEVPQPNEGHPYGWYNLTVGVPRWFNAESPRSYRWIGLYCSSACLAAGLPAIMHDEELMAHAYQRD